MKGVNIMKNWKKLKLIKDNFYTYYRMAGYDKVASSPLTPKDDQTIFFSNSAIVSFKPYLDKESPRLFLQLQQQQQRIQFCSCLTPFLMLNY